MELQVRTKERNRRKLLGMNLLMQVAPTQKTTKMKTKMKTMKMKMKMTRTRRMHLRHCHGDQIFTCMMIALGRSRELQSQPSGKAKSCGQRRRIGGNTTSLMIRRSLRRDRSANLALTRARGAKGLNVGHGRPVVEAGVAVGHAIESTATRSDRMSKPKQCPRPTNPHDAAVEAALKVEVPLHQQPGHLGLTRRAPRLCVVVA